VFVVLLLNGEKNTGYFADAHQCLALYRRQTLFRGLNTFRFTCGMRYFNPLIIIQVMELTWLCYDLCLLCYLLNDEKNTGYFADAHQCLALYRRQTLIRGLNTFSSTCAMRYFKPLIINQVTERSFLCYDLFLLCYR
jgi:hypothetical protein